MSFSRFTNVVLVSMISIAFAVAQDGKAKPGPADAAPSVSVPAYPNAKCPIMGNPVSANFVDTDYGRIYYCCGGCAKKIQADPERAYKSAYPKSREIENKTCPVTGAAIDAKAQTIKLQGYEFKVGSKECVKEARANSQLVLARLLNPKAKFVDNKTCPVTGKPVDANCMVLIGDELVCLSSLKAVDDVRKAPKQMLERARDLAAGKIVPPLPADEKKPGHDGHDPQGHDSHHH